MFRIALVKPGPMTDELWEWMVPGIEDAMQYDPLPFSLTDLRLRIEDEQMIVLLGYNDDDVKGFAILEMGAIGSLVQAIRIVYAWVDDKAAGLRKFMYEELREFAKREGCTAIIFSSMRKGWMRYFQPLSFNFMEKL